MLQRFTEYNFDNLGLPKELSAFANKMHKEYRENGKMLFVKIKFQQQTNLQLLKFNSSSITNSVIILFKRKEHGRVDLNSVEVIVKKDRELTYSNFTKPRKVIESKTFDLIKDLNGFFDYIAQQLWIDDNLKKTEDVIFECRLGVESYTPEPDMLVAAEIIGYNIVDQNTIKLTLKGKNKEWFYDIDAKKATLFTSIRNLVGMLLVISPDGGYKIVGRTFRNRLKLI